jgi:hypothetical protein
MKAKASSVSISKQWNGDQVWLRSSEDGEEWVLVRIAKPQNVRNSRSSLLNKPAILLGNIPFKLTLEVPDAAR